MYPIILRLGRFNLYSYGLMLFISFLLGIKLTSARAKKFGVKEELISNLALHILFGAIIGSRLLYVFLHWSEFENDIIGIFAFWRGGLGGLMFFGGFGGGLLSGIYYVRKRRLPLRKMLDASSPALALGEFFTRIGCFLNGCCFGKPTASFCGIKFPKSSPAGIFEKVYPTQLYSSLFGLILFLFIIFFLEKRRLKPGMVFALTMIIYASFRFLIDFIRYYENLANFWTNQAIAVGLIVIGFILLIRFQKGEYA
ncbi:MAG: prolipoprotein diacylglyceryl transferase family protein [candidate division WOR-3 bacterium]